MSEIKIPVAGARASGALRFMAIPMLVSVSLGGAVSSAEHVTFQASTTASQGADLRAGMISEETRAILNDPEMMAAIEEGDAAVEAGDVIDLDEFRRVVQSLRS